MSTIDNTWKNPSCPVAEVGFSQQIGRYLMSVKVGNYYEFSSFAHSNQRHYHECYELVMVIDGHGEFEHKGITSKLNRGDLYISKPYESHEIHIKPSQSMRVFYLFFQLETAKTKEYIGDHEAIITEFMIHHKAFAQKNKDMLAYIDFLNTYGQHHSKGDDRWLISHLTNFILQSMERLSHRKAGARINTGKYELNTFEVILDYIDEHIEKALNASMIALEIGVSRRTLYHMFEKNLGRSAHDYIKEKKIEFAKHYLLKGVTVTEAAGLVGFSSLPYFSRVFKAYVGVSPSVFVKQSEMSVKGTGRRLTD